MSPESRPGRSSQPEIQASEETTSNKETEQNYPYDAIVVLGAQMVWNSKIDKWQLPTIKEDYAGKIVGGNSKALAAQMAFEQGMTNRILVTGGPETAIDQDTGREVQGSRADELRDAITNRIERHESHRPPAYEDAVISIGTIGNTQGNVTDMANYFKQHPEILHNKKIAILSWAIHLERFQYFVDDNPFFKENDIEMNLLSVEELLAPTHQRWLDTVKATPEWQTYEQMERKGIADKLSGTYQSGKKT